MLDVKQVYHQIPIAKKSQGDLTINTQIGLFTFKRLPNGIHSDPAITIFQRIMDNLLSDIPKAVSRLDDILVAGIDEEDHLRTLSLVLERLLTAGFRLNKCKFFNSVLFTMAIRLPEKVCILLKISLQPFVMPLDRRMLQL